MEFTLGKYDRKVLDALDVVGIIQKEYPDADIECLGECDFVVEYKYCLLYTSPSPRDRG